MFSNVVYICCNNDCAKLSEFHIHDDLYFILAVCPIGLLFHRVTFLKK